MCLLLACASILSYSSRTTCSFRRGTLRAQLSVRSSSRLGLATRRSRYWRLPFPHAHVFHTGASGAQGQRIWSPLVRICVLKTLLEITRCTGRLAATLGAKSSFRKLPKRSVLTADISQLCGLIVEPSEPLALRLSSNLMIGVARCVNTVSSLLYL